MRSAICSAALVGTARTDAATIRHPRLGASGSCLSVGFFALGLPERRSTRAARLDKSCATKAKCREQDANSKVGIFAAPRVRLVARCVSLAMSRALADICEQVSSFGNAVCVFRCRYKPLQIASSGMPPLTDNNAMKKSFNCAGALSQGLSDGD